MSVVPPSSVGSGTDGIFDGLGFYSIQEAAGIPNEDREDLLGPFHRDRCIKFHVLFTAVTYKDELGLGEVVENIDNSLAFSRRRSRQEAVKE